MRDQGPTGCFSGFGLLVILLIFNVLISPPFLRFVPCFFVFLKVFYSLIVRI